ncbi:hypothetical protein NDU88_000724 [Pleurodeles waltl]|uniref:Integrase catalytic domain-containing protein n=1 Tax=Pleurodeles waltl TaxID=8319 RepID=A0AAV7VWW6_PLEWA|nr:hypothetical protein NDU88_000724 [Pleurodeles waltl]
MRVCLLPLVGNSSRVAACWCADIRLWISECDQCRQQIVPTELCREMQKFKVSEVWEFLSMDVIGPLPATIHGHMFILIVTDLFSKWVEAVPLKTKSAQEVIQNLVNIFLRCGCPKLILSDQGQHFVKQINMEVSTLFTVPKPVTAVYHPQTNTLDEMTNALIKSTLAECVSEHKDDWDNYVTSAVFSIVTKPNNTTKVSPFFLMYNREARFPSEIATDHLKPFIHAQEDLLNNTKQERVSFQVVNQPNIEELPVILPTDCLDTVEEQFGGTLSNNQLFDMECEHAYSSVRASAWDNGSNGTISNVLSPKRKRSCADDESIVSNGIDEPGEERTPKSLCQVTRGSFVSIRPNQGVFQTESWKPHGSTLYHPVVSQLLVNIEKYDQISFEEGAFFIGDASGGCLQKESGHAIHCWRYDEKEKKLFIALSFLFTNFFVFQEIACLLGAV